MLGTAEFADVVGDVVGGGLLLGLALPEQRGHAGLLRRRSRL
jgi:hypothetical protein